MGKYDVKVSHFHDHKDGSKGWDIYVKDERGNTEYKMHVNSQSEKGDSEGKSFLESITDAIGSLFGKK